MAIKALLEDRNISSDQYLTQALKSMVGHGLTPKNTSLVMI